MPRLTLCAALGLGLALSASAQPVTGLAGWSVVIDPGHSLTENGGIFGYSEAEKTLAVGLELRRLLVEETDIGAANVYMTRTTGDVQVSLTERTDFANTVGAAYFHSIHSDAGGADANSTLVMYGGWRENGETVEKTPRGGSVVAGFIDVNLTAAMRIGRRGPYADRTFYQGFPFEHANKYPYLHVNRESDMASTLSEAGFHTNPDQNQRNMNADWKRMEARAIFWSFLQYRGAARPPVHIVRGYVRDVESGLPVNGAVVEVGDRSYTTDTYESLFNRFSSDPGALRNGFYYVEDAAPGQSVVRVVAEGFEPFTTTVTPVDTFFTALDLDLVSNRLPVVALASPTAGQEGFPITSPIALTFSRPMDRASVEAAFAISPAVTGRFAWQNGNRRVVFTPDTLAAFTDYTLTIGAGARSPFGYALDGNADGSAGDAFRLAFRTGAPDVVAPSIAGVFPASNAREVERQPIVSITFSELIDPATIAPGGFVLEPTAGGSAVAGTVHAGDAGGQTVVWFAPDAPLAPSTFYRMRVQPGLRDLVGNAVTRTYSFVFQTRADADETAAIETFEGDFAARWWEPLQSGSTTTGTIVADSTFFAADTTFFAPFSGHQAMALHYGWRPAETGSFLIREYLPDDAPGNRLFDASYRLQAYVFGDASGTQFRFAVNDGPSQHEVSPWHRVDWLGWRLVEWDLSRETPGTWIGNGTLDGGALRFDSFQLSYAGGAAYGTLYIDDLRLARATATAVDEKDARPAAVVMEQSYPNPFRDRTLIAFTLDAPRPVTLRVFDALGRAVALLADGSVLAAGPHRVDWDASAQSSGVYLVRLEAGGEVRTQTLTLLR